MDEKNIEKFVQLTGEEQEWDLVLVENLVCEMCYCEGNNELKPCWEIYGDFGTPLCDNHVRTQGYFVNEVEKARV